MTVRVWRWVIGVPDGIQALIVRSVRIQSVRVNATSASGYGSPANGFNHSWPTLVADEPSYWLTSQRVNSWVG